MIYEYSLESQEVSDTKYSGNTDEYSHYSDVTTVFMRLKSPITVYSATS